MILSTKTISEVFSYDDFSFLQPESNHEQLWRALVNCSSEEYTSEKAEEVIIYGFENVSQYSLVSMGDITIGFRIDIILFLTKILNQVGWIDTTGKYIINSDENVISIAKWIFGEGAYRDKGILEIIGREERGVLGLYDLLLFRLFCCADRGGDIFNLSRALSKHGNINAPTSGSYHDIVVEEMREISQQIFYIFKSQFIDKKINIFTEIDNITADEVCGKYFTYIKSELESGNISNEDFIKQLMIIKSNMKSFIIYQLGNNIIDSGIGCGYYDFTGVKDEKGIRHEINDYLFNFCFNPQIDENNYIIFIEYLLLNYSHAFEFRSTVYKLNLNDVTKALEKDQLITYWRENSSKIKKLNYEHLDRKVYTSNYVATFSDHLVSVYEFLDKLLEG